MPGAKEAAKVAEACAYDRTREHQVLTQLMCWDAVMHVAMLAGVIDEQKYKASKGQPRLLANETDPGVPDVGAMVNLPPGYALVFYEDRGGAPNPIHAMISVGLGKAAGNKNDCVGAGSMLGWEVLDLATDLKWSTNGITAPLGVTPAGVAVTRSVKIYARSIDQMT